jgi:hypothetical protein
MHPYRTVVGIATMFLLVCALMMAQGRPPGVGGGPPSGGGDTDFGNNLSVPVIFAEGIGVLGGTVPVSSSPVLAGDGTGLRPAAGEVFSSLPMLTTPTTVSVGGVTYTIYLQGTENLWRAQWVNGHNLGAIPATANWSDNLTKQSWTATSTIRVEMVLTAPTMPAMEAYGMVLLGSKRASTGGTTGLTFSSTANVYGSTARLRIQKITGKGGAIVPNFPCSFDGAVYERYGVDGSGGFSAEVNVAGAVVYGFNWPLSQWNCGSTIDKAGWWRLTFLLDPVGLPSVNRNVYLNALDPGDLGALYEPRLFPHQTELDILIVSDRGGGPRRMGR